MLAHSLILLLLFLKLYGITRILLLIHKINLHFCILFSFAVLLISKSFISDVLILVNCGPQNPPSAQFVPFVVTQENNATSGPSSRHCITPI